MPTSPEATTRPILASPKHLVGAFLAVLHRATAGRFGRKAKTLLDDWPQAIAPFRANLRVAANLLAAGSVGQAPVAHSPVVTGAALSLLRLLDHLVAPRRDCHDRRWQQVGTIS